MTKPAILTVNLAKIVVNWQQYTELCPTAQVSAVIKANAYGTGMVQVYHALKQAGCNTFWVATLNEAIELKAFDKSANVFVLGGISTDTIDDFIKHNISPVLNTIEQLQLWVTQASTIGVWIQFNTSMNRFGINASDVDTVLNTLHSSPINVLGYMSHLLAGEESQSPFNITQKKIFDKIIAQLPPAKVSLCNTGGSFLGEDYHYDMVRIGIGLYGIPCSDKANTNFENPLALQAPVQNVRDVPKGQCVGYNASFTADNDMTVATIGIGYADGVNVALSNKANVYYNNKALPIVGRISMDSMGIDISDLSCVTEDTMLTIFDSADDISIISACTEIPEHAVLASLTHRIIRKYQ